MKKKDLLKLATFGISTGLLLSGCQSSNPKRNNNTEAAENANQDTEQFYDSLSSESQKKFDELDASHRKMAMAMMEQSCTGKNTCRGMGGCKTNEHACAGKNDCKGKGGSPIGDADKAVQVQYENQMKERNKMGKRMPEAGKANEGCKGKSACNGATKGK